MIRRDKIDVLIDAKLHCSENRLMVLARKPAPVQVSWLGYPGSSGLETMDYRVTDENLEPGGGVYPFAEEPIYIADCFWVYDSLGIDPGVNALPALSAGHVTFGSLNNFCKTSDATLSLWASALKAVAGSRLLVLAPKGSARPRFLEKMRGLGIESDRIGFLEHVQRLEYLENYNRIDICLDTLPYNGHTTSLDALWMGVPVITLPGQTPPGRVGLTHAKNLNLPDLVAKDEEDFARIVARLASDLPALDRLRQSLRGRLEKSPLMDGPGFARKMEEAYRRIWKKWCEGKKRRNAPIANRPIPEDRTGRAHAGVIQGERTRQRGEISLRDADGKAGILTRGGEQISHESHEKGADPVPRAWARGKHAIGDHCAECGGDKHGCQRLKFGLRLAKEHHQYGGCDGLRDQRAGSGKGPFARDRFGGDVIWNRPDHSGAAHEPKHHPSQTDHRGQDEHLRRQD